MLPVSCSRNWSAEHPGGEVFKTITSSGTTGQRVSRIFLDGATSACQQQAPLPDHVRLPGGSGGCPSWCWTAGRFCATAPCSPPGGGHSGLFHLRHQACYALDEHMELDLDGVRAFLEEHQGDHLPLRLHPFMIWKHVVRALEERGEAGHPPTASWFTAAGGRSWPARRCPPGEFKARVAAATGVERVSNYYGMAEQTGCIYMECPQGHLHASLWSDIVVRRGRDYRPCEPGGGGGAPRCSPPLPRSYPGHSLLTEDLGVLLGRMTAPAGAGQIFQGDGEVPEPSEGVQRYREGITSRFWPGRSRWTPPLAPP